MRRFKRGGNFRFRQAFFIGAYAGPVYKLLYSKCSSEGNPRRLD